MFSLSSTVYSAKFWIQNSNHIQSNIVSTLLFAQLMIIETKKNTFFSQQPFYVDLKVSAVIMFLKNPSTAI